jgi:hypothetical protein
MQMRSSSNAIRARAPLAGMGLRPRPEERIDARCGDSPGYLPRPGDRTVREAGMTFHLIPAIWRDDRGLEITESFLVAAGGAEPFCSYPRKLLVKP